MGDTKAGRVTAPRLNTSRSLQLRPVDRRHRAYEPPRDIAPYLEQPKPRPAKQAFAGWDPNENNEGW